METGEGFSITWILPVEVLLDTKIVNSDFKKKRKKLFSFPFLLLLFLFLLLGNGGRIGSGVIHAPNSWNHHTHIRIRIQKPHFVPLVKIQSPKLIYQKLYNLFGSRANNIFFQKKVIIFLWSNLIFYLRGACAIVFRHQYWWTAIPPTAMVWIQLDLT